MKARSRILLISNSTVYGRSYLDHVEEEIKNFLGRAGTVLFFPFALHDHNGYAAKASARFAALGYSLESAHQFDNPAKAVEKAAAIFIGGGNTSGARISRRGQAPVEVAPGAEISEPVGAPDAV
jgi:dipeptidase E